MTLPSPIARLRPALLPLLASLLLSACALAPTQPASTGTVAAVTPAAVPVAEPAAPAAAPPVVAVATPPAPTTVPAADEGPAAGTPTDPLSPDRPTHLHDEAARADLWERVRRGFAMNDLEGDLVADRERWYATRPDYVRRMTERGGRYLFHIVEEVERRGLPTELALLPFIESAFNPQAMSSAKASGMWQFIPSTGKYFDLTQNVFRDDRRDVLASTRAALDYLERLYGMFGDWHLALAAYNWGEGSVSRAIARNQRAGLGTAYTDLRMPAETRWYVPKLQAVKNIIARPDAFDIELPPLQNHPYFLSVPIQRDIDAALAARLAGLSLDEFKALNPSLNKPVILAAGTPQILLPYDNTDRFLRNLAEHRGPLASWTAWVVPRTMRPAQAAQEAGMSEAALREVNRIPPRMLVKAGSTLLVPRSAQRQQDVSEHVADNAVMQLAPDAPPARRVTVKARKGDTVASLAARHKLTAAQVAGWNKLPANARLSAGQNVTLMLPGSTGRKNTAVASAKRKPAARAVAAKAPSKAARPATRGAAADRARTSRAAR
jgi:membrane-bound lytic murein transglycosylase D